MFPIVCALCGKNQTTELYPATFSERDITKRTYSARRLPDHIHYRIVRCVKCGLIFSSPILSPKKIEHLYRKGSCTYRNEIPFLAQTYLGLFKRIENRLPPKPRIVEVGCGNGFFLQTLYTHGFTEIYGVEPGKDMASCAPPRIRKRITVDIFKKNQFPKNSFDVICCFHTLDHLVDPNAFLKLSRDILKPHGFMIIVVHDTDGLSVQLFKERSPIFDIEHIYLYNKKTLRMRFAQNSYDVLDVFNLINTYPLSYWVRMSGLPEKIKSTLVKIIDRTKIGTVPFSLAGGNIGIIVQNMP